MVCCHNVRMLQFRVRCPGRTSLPEAALQLLPACLPLPQNKHKFLEQQKEKEGRERGGGGGKAPKTGGCQSPQMAALEHQQQQAWEEQQVQQQQQDPAKRLRSVQKKLRQIAALEEKQRAGQALSPEEAAKLAQRQQVEAEGAQLAGQVHRV